jgi:hypothetical protein
VLAGSHVELGAMQRTCDRVVTQSSVRQSSVTMRAIVVEGEQLALHTTHHHTVGSHTFDALHGALGEVGEITRS